MSHPRFAILRAALVFAAAALAAPSFAQPAAAPAAKAEKAYDQIQNIVYEEDIDGAALVMDIFTPKGTPNGLAVVDVASGAWHSDRGKIRDHDRAGFYDVFCARGYKVFAVRPGSVSRFTGAEMLAHCKRGVRWVREHAGQYGIDPERIGLTGASAGGHLGSLTAVTADAGNPQAKDPIDRHSSAVKACGVFFPPTDFTRWGAGKVLARSKYSGLFFNDGCADGKTDADWEAAMTAISPAKHVTAAAPPFIIFHGTKDPLVPLQQSEFLVEALKGANVPVELVIKEGGGHPWPTIREEVVKLADWFDAALRK